MCEWNAQFSDEEWFTEKSTLPANKCAEATLHFVSDEDGTRPLDDDAQKSCDDGSQKPRVHKKPRGTAS
jgi:hypothetical protein